MARLPVDYALSLSLAACLLGRGLIWLMPGARMDAAGYDLMLLVGGPVFWGTVCTLTGAGLIAGVWINGAWRASPHLRFFTLTAAATLWLVLAASFVSAGTTEGLQAGFLQGMLAVQALVCISYVYRRSHVGPV